MKLIINGNKVELSMANEMVRIGNNSRHSISTTVDNPSIPIDSIRKLFTDFNEKTTFSIENNNGDITDYSGFSNVEISKSNTKTSDFINIVFSKDR